MENGSDFKPLISAVSKIAIALSPFIVGWLRDAWKLRTWRKDRKTARLRVERRRRNRRSRERRKSNEQRKTQSPPK